MDHIVCGWLVCGSTCEGPCWEGVLGVEGCGEGLFVEVVGEGGQLVSEARRCVIALEDVGEAVCVKGGLVDAGCGGEQGTLLDGGLQVVRGVA